MDLCNVSCFCMITHLCKMLIIGMEYDYGDEQFFFLIGIAGAVSRVPRCSWKTGKIVEIDFVLSWQKKNHCL